MNIPLLQACIVCTQGPVVMQDNATVNAGDITESIAELIPGADILLRVDIIRKAQARIKEQPAAPRIHLIFCLIVVYVLISERQLNG